MGFLFPSFCGFWFDDNRAPPITVEKIRVQSVLNRGTANGLKVGIPSQFSVLIAILYSSLVHRNRCLPLSNPSSEFSFCVSHTLCTRCPSPECFLIWRLAEPLPVVLWWNSVPTLFRKRPRISVLSVLERKASDTRARLVCSHSSNTPCRLTLVFLFNPLTCQ